MQSIQLPAHEICVNERLPRCARNDMNLRVPSSAYTCPPAPALHAPPEEIRAKQSQFAAGWMNVNFWSIKELREKCMVHAAARTKPILPPAGSRVAQRPPYLLQHPTIPVPHLSTPVPLARSGPTVQNKANFGGGQMSANRRQEKRLRWKDMACGSAKTKPISRPEGYPARIRSTPTFHHSSVPSFHPRPPDAWGWDRAKQSQFAGPAGRSSAPRVQNKANSVARHRQEVLPGFEPWPIIRCQSSIIDHQSPRTASGGRA
jgi:hypothetical protein